MMNNMYYIKKNIIAYFVQLPDSLKLNEEMFFWIFANKETIEEVIEGIVKV
ncbi:aminoglycoside phosphotransferase [Bacillus cereus]|uniref:hypothetical protein n=1 Tax=Bacillus cereus TaxID=1396 RepID=UPI0001D3A930|nr:hypothetical protein [Bacillus cereus]ADH07318.1 Aminoglycoside phosphotransferase [Bacillus thuringiensis BMB171]MDZ4485638.1 aminoglycoside phosphotransferase [Bacillus cereus]